MAGHSDAAYCLCSSGASEAAMQKVIDYACGSGADCRPILQSGACYNPNTLLGHCSYAVNSYYQSKSTSGGTCDFGGVAALSSTGAPSGSSSTCVYPSSPGNTTSPTTGTPSTTTPSATTPAGTATTTIPGTGSLGPSGSFGDASAAAATLQRANPCRISCLVDVGIWFSGMVFLWRG